MAREQAVTTKAKQGMAAMALDVAVIRCEGEMGEFELAHVGEELFRLVNRGRRKVVLDLTGVDHVDFRGVKPLAARAKTLRAAGGDIRLAGLSSYVAAIFRAAGIEDEFELYETAEDAKASFTQSPMFAVVR